MRKLAFASLTVLTVVGLPTEADAQTSVPSGNLVGSQTWTAAGSPYLLTGDVTVPLGTTLTIQSGATVQASLSDDLGSGEDSGLVELRVAGTLAVQGTAPSPVTLRSNQASGSPSDWYGLVLLAGASANIANLTVRDADTALLDRSTSAVVSGLHLSDNDRGVLIDGGSPTITGGLIADNSGYGIQLQNGADATISGLVIEDNGGNGVHAVNSNLDISTTIVRRNQNTGIYAQSTSGTRTVVIDHNTVHDNGSYGIYLYEYSGTLAVTVQNNLIMSNQSYGVYATGSPASTVSHNLTFDQSSNYAGVSGGTGAISENPLVVDAANDNLRPTSRSGARMAASDGSDIGALPYTGDITPTLSGHLFSNTTLTSAASPHVIAGDLTVEPSVTLTIEPGAELVFDTSDLMASGDDANLAELRVHGTLVADGTQSLGISIGSASDTPGDWYGIRLLSDSSASIIDYATIEDANYGVHTSAPSGTVIQRSTIRNNDSHGVYADGGSPALSQLVVTSNGGNGVHMVNASGSVTGSRIYDNGGTGVYLQNTTGTHSVDVLHNTIVGHSSYGGYFYEYSGTLNVTFRNNLVADNGSYGVYATGSPAMTVSHNLIFGQSSAYAGTTGGTGAIAENPLLADQLGRDLRITSRSPARLHASDGSDIGALAFDGTPTVGVQGHLYEDTVWAPDNGPIAVLGDVTIEPGVTLTIQPGTEVELPAGADSMGGNADTSRTELIALGRLIVDGDPNNKVLFTSNGAEGDWYGLVIEASSAATAIEHAIIEMAEYGVRSKAPATASIAQSEIRSSGSHGLYIEAGGITVDGVYSHANQGNGIHVVNASSEITNVLVSANSSTGIYLQNTSGTHTVAVRHATIQGHGSYGIYAYEYSGTLNVTVDSSVITENGSYGIYATGSPVMTVSYNNVWGHSTDYAGVSAGSGSISANPGFVNTGLGNFHLLPSSVAIDVANPATPVDHDLDGLLRPLDGDSNATALPDMGAFEYNPSGNQWPIADAGPDRVVASGLATVFDASGSYDPDGTISAYLWDFGDGTPTQSGAQVSHTFSGGTDRTVTLTVTDNAGAIDVDTIAVEVNLPPTADAGAERYADPGEVVSFSGAGSSDSDGSITAYSWSFGDGAQASGVSVTHQYSSGGDFTVTLTVTDDDGATSISTTIAHITGNDGAPPIIVHTPVVDGQTANTAITVSADITDSSGVAAATLYYRRTGSPSFSTTAMSLVSGATYQAQIPAASVGTPSVEYYIEASDGVASPNTGTHPPSAPALFHTFTVIGGGNDTTPPGIVHTPIGAGQPEGSAVAIDATITDASGVASAILYYRLSGAGGFGSTPMMNVSGDLYSATIPAGSVAVPGVDYYIWAEDASAAANTTTSPPGAPGSFHSFTVVSAVAIAPGDVIVTEIMKDPSGTETLREWFEVYNTTQTTIDLGGVSFSDDGTDSFTVQGSLSIAAGSYLVFGRSSDTAQNGGVSVGYVYSGMALSNTSDEIVIGAGAVEVDRVAYDDGVTFPNTPGHSISLDPGALDMTSNDVGSSWCESSSILQSGDYGTPGASNDSCTNPNDTTPPSIVHTPVPNGQQAGTAVSVSAVVTDPSGVDLVELSYRVTGQPTFTTVTMIEGASNVFSVQIPAAEVTTAGVDYYITASDASLAANEATEPSGAPAAFHSFLATIDDTAGPTITHVPIADGQPEQQSVSIVATVTDDSGIGTVTLFFRSNGGTWFTASMTDGGNGYEGLIPAASVVAPNVEYYIAAEDASPGRNVSFLPAGGDSAPFVFSVARVDFDPPVIEHTPDPTSRPTHAAIDLSALITDDSGVAEARLYFRPGGVAAFDSVLMTESSGGLYNGSIPAESVNGTAVDYYIEATDASDEQNTARHPGDAPTSFHSIVLVEGEDMTGPNIAHDPIAEEVPSGEPFTLVAVVTDPSGVGSAQIYYRMMGTGDFSQVALVRVEGTDQYSAEIPAEAVHSPGLEYYFQAYDASASSNASVLPAAIPDELFVLHVAFEGSEQPRQRERAEEGGCGCSATPSHSGAGGHWLVLLFGVLLGLGRALDSSDPRLHRSVRCFGLRRR